MLFSE
ncbi:hypothetical protein ACTFIZ_006736 [Dictyostelium cf. discoideum]